MSREDDFSASVSVLWLAVARADRIPVGARRRRHAAVDEQQLLADAHFERQAAGLRARRKRQRRRPPDIGNDDGIAALEPRVAGSARLGRAAAEIRRRRRARWRGRPPERSPRR